MLLIRTHQIDSLLEPHRRTHLAALAQRLRRRHPEALASRTDVQLCALCVEGLNRATAYGCQEPPHDERYLDLMVVLGEDFDVSPDTHWAGEILRTPMVFGSAKLDQIERHRAMGDLRSARP